MEYEPTEATSSHFRAFLLSNEGHGRRYDLLLACVVVFD
jgi:hypothetical protein